MHPDIKTYIIRSIAVLRYAVHTSALLVSRRGARERGRHIVRSQSRAWEEPAGIAGPFRVMAFFVYPRRSCSLFHRSRLQFQKNLNDNEDTLDFK